ncbi:MAG: DapH/DapD/GlmU-related protein [Smithellaceae bacterium]
MYVRIIKGVNVYIHGSVKSYGTNYVGDNSMIMENVILGYPTSDIFVELRNKNEVVEDLQYEGCKIGSNSILRPGVAVYKDTIIGNDVRTGHNVLIREKCVVGNNVLLGTNVVIDNNSTIGNNVSIQSSVYIPTGSTIEDYVFLGPNCVLLNDMYPIRFKGALLTAPIIRKGASIGGNATLRPGIEVGEGAIVAAGAIVTKNVPAWHMAMGSPAKFVKLKKELCAYNHIY